MTQVFDPTVYKKGWEIREREYKRALSNRVRRARAFLKKIVATFLAMDPDMEKLILFGSLARGKPKNLEFDIDLAVRSHRYLKLLAWTLNQKWKIDLVDLEEIGTSILEEVERSGVVLYEKKAR